MKQFMLVLVFRSSLLLCLKVSVNHFNEPLVSGYKRLSEGLQPKF